MSVDLRTRSDGRVVEVDPAAFFGEELPAALDDAAHRLEPAVLAKPLRPLTVDVDGGGWTLTVANGRATVERGHGDGATLRIDRDQLRDLVTDQATPVAWLASGALRLEGGGLAQVLDWWLVIRAALDGTAPHVAGAVELRDEDGRPLDLSRSFTTDDDPRAMAHFLHEAGFLHVAGVFTEDEMAVVSSDMDRAAPDYAKGDGRSWWATLADGTDALVRMQAFDERSPAVAEQLGDDRLLRIGRLTGDGHQLRQSANRIEALFKPIGVEQGISDIPWHKDCSLGRHSYECCSVTVGISVTGADAESGQLRVVAGSHRALVWPAPSLQPGLDLPVVDLPTRTGDLTVHLSCTLHMAQPPVVHERRVMYTSFQMAPLDPDGARGARARLGAVREAAPVTVSQPSATG